jgi:hypothetical protein
MSESSAAKRCDERSIDERLEHDRGGEPRLGPVAHGGELLDVLAHLLPDGVLLPGGDVRLPGEGLELLVELEGAEDHVLRDVLGDDVDPRPVPEGEGAGVLR